MPHAKAQRRKEDGKRCCDRDISTEKHQTSASEPHRSPSEHEPSPSEHETSPSEHEHSPSKPQPSASRLETSSKKGDRTLFFCELCASAVQWLILTPQEQGYG
ncbi:hypothetical protein [Calothrix sp. NIES-2100]|uniref:hypothetical protein n=1 Tax=Calothrix sp. NIES-2100 TaxID=1954172 RepID=UPI0030D83C83